MVGRLVREDVHAASGEVVKPKFGRLLSLRYKGAMKPKNIPALTGLRFFAAMAIVLTHSQDGLIPMGSFWPFDLTGAVAVFFVLSGFVLTIGADQHRSWSDFFVARVARIWPMHLAALVFLLILFYPWSTYYFHHAETLEQLPINALLLQSWFPDRATYWSYNAPSWSISCELFFYATFPIAVVLLSRQSLLRLTVLISVIFCGIILIGKARPDIDPNWLGQVLPLSCYGDFAIGIAACTWWKLLPPAKTSYGHGTIIQFAALALAVGANAFFATRAFIPSIAAASSFLHASGPAPFYAALLFALARYDGLLSRGLSIRIVVYGGEISYSLYLVHQLLIRRHHTIPAFLAHVPFQFADFLVIAFVTSIAAHHLIEKPARRRILALWRSIKQQPQRGIAADTAD
jgi:peptidoglycan/LPS O-acetylase OafA/YrhL